MAVVWMFVRFIRNIDFLGKDGINVINRHKRYSTKRMFTHPIVVF